MPGRSYVGFGPLWTPNKPNFHFSGPLPLKFKMDRVILAVYGIEIFRGGDSQLPSKFGGNVDHLTLFHDFVNHVLTEAKKLPGKNGRTSHRFTYANHTLPILDTETRELYGFFKTGRDGDVFTAGKYKEDGSIEGAEASVTRDMHSMRDSFFYLKVPKEAGKKRSYLIIQQPEGQGIKGLVFHFLQQYMDSKGLSDFRAIPFNLIPEKVFTRMMADGNFKELTLIKYGIPDTMEGTGNQEEMVPIERGKMKVIYQANNLGSRFKEWGLGLFGATRQSSQSSHKSKVVVALSGQEEEYDEVSMLLELNGKKKTFHLASSSRTQPDVDVTSNVQYDIHGRLKVDQLLIQARELVDDVSLDIPPNDIVS